MKFYNEWALRIADGQWTDGKAFYGLPGYAYFLGIFYGIFGFAPFLVSLLQAVSEALIGVVLFKITQSTVTGYSSIPEKTQANWIGYFAVASWAFLLPAQAFSVILMPTTFLVLAYWGGILWILKSASSDIPMKAWPIIGIITGFIAMVIATIFFILPLFLCRLVLNVWRQKITPLQKIFRIVAASLFLFCGVIIGASPCWIHNYFIAKDRVFLSAHSGINFWIGNNPTGNGYPKIPPGLRSSQEGLLKDSLTYPSIASGRELSRSEVSQYWNKKAKDYITSNFSDWLRLVGVKMKNFWNTYQYDDLSIITPLREDHIITPGLPFGFFAALSIPGAFLALKRYPRSIWIIAGILLHMASLLTVFVTERYRLAAAPGLILITCIGLREWWSCLVLSQWKPVFIYILMTAASLWFVTLPVSDSGLWALDYYNTGLKQTEIGDMDRAKKNLEIAYAFTPENAENNFALGNFWLKKGDRDKAKFFYRKTIELNKKHSSAFNNLGVLAMEENLWPLAEKLISISLQIEPEDAKVHYLMARVKLHLTKKEEALQHINKSLSLKPEQKEFLDLKEEITAE